MLRSGWIEVSAVSQSCPPKNIFLGSEKMYLWSRFKPVVGGRPAKKLIENKTQPICNDELLMFNPYETESFHRVYCVSGIRHHTISNKLIQGFNFKNLDFKGSQETKIFTL